MFRPTLAPADADFEAARLPALRRSEAFAEDLFDDEPAAVPLTAAPRRDGRRGAALLLGLPLVVALAGTLQQVLASA